jgi:hypothetical protein
MATRANNIATEKPRKRFITNLHRGTERLCVHEAVTK